MKYIEITVNTTTAAEELVSDIFFDFTLEGVCIYDKNDLINLNKKCHHWDYIEDDIINSYGEETLVKGFIKADEYQNISKALSLELKDLKQRSQNVVNVGSLEITTREIEGDDWVNTWKEYFKPIKIKDVIICPKWIKYDTQKNEKIVLIDVGMAFGTGEHETTSLCIELMQEVNLDGAVVYDIGTGSGILGITAVKLGAKKAVMSDIDEIAVEAAKNNAKLNGVEKSCEITLRNLLDGEASEADAVVSNITAEVLILMAKDIADIMKKGRPLILSGILTDRVNMVLYNYGEYFNVKKTLVKGDWCGMLLERK